MVLGHLCFECLIAGVLSWKLALAPWCIFSQARGPKHGHPEVSCVVGRRSCLSVLLYESLSQCAFVVFCVLKWSFFVTCREPVLFLLLHLRVVLYISKHTSQNAIPAGGSRRQPHNFVRRTLSKGDKSLDAPFRQVSLAVAKADSLSLLLNSLALSPAPTRRRRISRTLQGGPQGLQTSNGKRTGNPNNALQAQGRTTNRLRPTCPIFPTAFRLNQST